MNIPIHHAFQLSRYRSEPEQPVATCIVVLGLRAILSMIRPFCSQDSSGINSPIILSARFSSSTTCVADGGDEDTFLDAGEGEGVPCHVRFEKARLA
jgi:hypothetical protein